MADIHLMYEPVGFDATKTACGLNCSPDRDPFHTLELTTEGKLVTCPKCDLHTDKRSGWMIEGVTHKRSAT